MATMKDVGAAYVSELFHAGASLGEAVDALDAILAEHDRAVAERAWDEAENHAYGTSYANWRRDSGSAVNPYRKES